MKNALRQALMLSMKDFISILSSPASLLWNLVFPLGFAIFIASVLGAAYSDNKPHLNVAIVSNVNPSDFNPAEVEFLGLNHPIRPSNVAQSAKYSSARHWRTLSADALLKALEKSRDITAQRTDLSDATTGLKEARYDVALIADTDEAILFGSQLKRLELLSFKYELDKILLAPSEEPLKIQYIEGENVDDSTYRTALSSALLWVMMGCAASFGIGVAQERRLKTYSRMVATGMSRGTILFGKGLSCIYCCVLDVALLVLFASLVWDITIPKPIHLLVAISTTLLCLTGMMTLISTMSRRESAVTAASWGSLLFLGMIGGVMIPPIALPTWVQSLGHFSPIHWSLNLISDGLSAGETSLFSTLPELLSSSDLALSLALFFICSLLSTWRERHLYHCGI